MATSTKYYYGVKVGKHPGIYNTWIECKAAIGTAPNAKFRKFETLQEAQNFVQSTQTIEQTPDAEYTTKITTTSSITTPPNMNSLKYDKLDKSCISYKATDWISYNNQLYIFTDGSCKRRNNKEIVYSGIGLYFGPNAMNISEELTGATNNQCELLAIDIAFKLIIKNADLLVNMCQPINIISDSEYAIKSVTIWIKKWKQNNWMTADNKPVKNKELIISIDNSMTELKKINTSIIEPTRKLAVKFLHVKSHREQPTEPLMHFIWEGNYIADALATNFS